jgi:hypothetical protein
MRQMLGHDAPPTNYWMENLLTGTPLTECPLRSVLRIAERDPALAAEIARHGDEYFPAFESGHLLIEGGVSDQPARYLAFMASLKSIRARQQARYDELTVPKDTPSLTPGDG